MDINVKAVLPTYKAAMRKQVPIALRAVAGRNHPEAPAEDYHRAALQSLHAYCFHESNFNLLSEMAQEHSIPYDIVPRSCDRSGSLVGLSLFVTLAESLRRWEEQRAAGQRPRSAIAASVVGQAGINVASAHLVLQATRALREGRGPRDASESLEARVGRQQADVAPLSEAHVRGVLQPLSASGDMHAFLRDGAAEDVEWRIMGHTPSVSGTYTAQELLAHWEMLLQKLHPNEYRMDIDTVFVDASRRTALVEMSGSAPLGSGDGRYQQSYCWVLGFDGAGRVRSVRAYLDTAVATTALFEGAH